MKKMLLAFCSGALILSLTGCCFDSCNPCKPKCEKTCKPKCEKKCKPKCEKTCKTDKCEDKGCSKDMPNKTCKAVKQVKTSSPKMVN